jgi:hypothetical protein
MYGNPMAPGVQTDDELAVVKSDEDATFNRVVAGLSESSD